MSELPPGWAWATLTDVIGPDGVFSDGDWVETKDQDPAGGVRLTQLADVGDGVFRDRSSRFLREDQAAALKCTFLEPGDVLVARMPDPLGRACVFPGLPQPAVTAVDVCIIRPGRDSVEPRWLMWAINAPQFRSRVADLQTGTTRRRISRMNLATIHLPAPPLNEQRRIVAAIEEQLSRLDAADASLLQAKRRAEAFVRATVVSALGGDWELVALRDVTDSQVYGTSSKASSDPGGVPVLRMGNINGGRLDLRNLKYLPSDHPDVAKFTLQPGDVLFNRTNSPELVGKSAVFTSSEPMTFASYLIRVRLTRDCDPRWAVLVINGPPGRRYIARVRSQQVGQANVNGTKLAAMPIPLPPLKEQRRIVAEADERLSVIDAMRASIERAERRSATLRRSILERAFRGELVPQDPSDEPASVLLDRIRAERAKAGPATRSRKAATSLPAL